jgi:DNA-directed RNA polymerase subunit RPC12/RpoP
MIRFQCKGCKQFIEIANPKSAGQLVQCPDCRTVQPVPLYQAFSFHCSACGEELSATPDQAGESVHCEYCGVMTFVPDVTGQQQGKGCVLTGAVLLALALAAGTASAFWLD